MDQESSSKIDAAKQKLSLIIASQKPIDAYEVYYIVGALCFFEREEIMEQAKILIKKTTKSQASIIMKAFSSTSEHIELVKAMIDSSIENSYHLDIPSMIKQYFDYDYDKIHLIEHAINAIIARGDCVKHYADIYEIASTSTHYAPTIIENHINILFEGVRKIFTGSSDDNNENFYCLKKVMNFNLYRHLSSESYKVDLAKSAIKSLMDKGNNINNYKYILDIIQILPSIERSNLIEQAKILTSTLQREDPCFDLREMTKLFPENALIEDDASQHTCYASSSTSIKFLGIPFAFHE